MAAYTTLAQDRLTREFGPVRSLWSEGGTELHRYGRRVFVIHIDGYFSLDISDGVQAKLNASLESDQRFGAIILIGSGFSGIDVRVMKLPKIPVVPIVWAGVSDRPVFRFAFKMATTVGPLRRVERIGLFSDLEASVEFMRREGEATGLLEAR